MIFWPRMVTTVQTLSEATKQEIARRVRDKVYEELKNNNYLESGYIFNIAKEIAENVLDVQFLQNENNDSFRVIGKIK